MTDRLKIIDYFEGFINEVDLKAETLLTQMPEQYHQHIMNKRKSFIDEIEQVKQYNLSNLNEDEKSTSEEKLFKKYCFSLQMNQMNGHRFLTYEKEQFY